MEIVVLVFPIQQVGRMYSVMAPYQANEEYVASSFVKTKNTTGLAQIKVEYFDDSNNWLDFSTSYGIKGTHDLCILCRHYVWLNNCIKVSN